MSAENFEQSLSVFAVYGVPAFSNHSISYKNENVSFTTDVNYDLITVNSTEEEINSFYFYRVSSNGKRGNKKSKNISNIINFLIPRKRKWSINIFTVLFFHRNKMLK